ncbi:CotH kinase family protein [bacterium]|nr:CotH kinase family protein [bacterium]
MHKLHQKIYLYVSLACLLLAIVIFVDADYRDLNVLVTNYPEFAFISHKSGRYPHALNVWALPNLQMPIWSTLHYTLDGQTPTSNSPRWHQPLHLESTSSGVRVYPLQVSLCYPSGACAGLMTRTYILGDQLENDLDIDIISLTTDNDNLYHEDTGIFVTGRQYADQPYHPLANYAQRGDEWIRPAHVTYITRDNHTLWQQAVGIQVSGDTSAAYDVKSLKLAAQPKNGYQPLDYSFVPVGDTQRWPIKTDYHSLRLRSGAQDIFTGNIRSSVASRLLAQTDFPGFSYTKRAVLYLNGTYYGIFEVQENYSDSWLKTRYNLPDSDHLEKVKGSELDVWTQLDLLNLFNQDFANPENRALLEAYIDMDDYLRYCAVNVLLNNRDWPHKNYEVWRWSGPPDASNPYTDGRWRFLFYDADFIYSLHDIFIAGRNQTRLASNSVLDNLLTTLPALQESSFAHIMNSQYYRQRFLQLLADWQHYPFNADNINDIIQQEQTKIDRQQRLHAYPGWEEDFYGGIKEMATLSAQIKTTIDQDVSRFWADEHKYTLTLTTDDYTCVDWLGRHLDPSQTYQTSYWTDTNFTLTANSIIGGQFQSWQVNGAPIATDTLDINQTLAVDGQLKVQVQSQPAAQQLMITDISAQGANDWLTLTNIGRQQEVLRDYYLSSSQDAPEKMTLPAISLTPGQSIRINGHNNDGQLGEGKVNLHWRAGESVYLWRDDKVVDQIDIPANIGDNIFKRDACRQISYQRQ